MGLLTGTEAIMEMVTVLEEALEAEEEVVTVLEEALEAVEETLEALEAREVTLQVMAVTIRRILNR